MADSKRYPEYVVNINGIDHTMRLSPEDVERYGDAAKKKSDSAKSNKAASARNKSA